MSLTYFGRLSGVWLITKVHYVLARQSGYTCGTLHLRSEGPIARYEQGKTRVDKSATQQVIEVKADGSVGSLVKRDETRRKITMKQLQLMFNTISQIDEQTLGVRGTATGL